MSEQRGQPEGMSRQAVCILIGALLGLFVAARLIFDDYNNAGQVPWAMALGIILGGCFVGFVVGILFAGQPPEPPKPPPTPPAAPTPPSEGIQAEPPP